MFGYSISEAPLSSLVDRAAGSIERGEPRLRLLAMNPAKIAMAERDPSLRDALGRAEVAFADGCGVSLAHRLIAGRRVARVPGVDLATALAAEATLRGWSLYLLGARPGIAEEAAANLRGRFPGLRVAGCQHGYFDERGERRIIDEIDRAAPEILLVALGSPAQELWIDRHFDELRVRVALGLGGTFDVWASRVRRAPVVFRRFGLEWLYRIAREPRRTGRFLRTQPRFFALVLRESVTCRLSWLSALPRALSRPGRLWGTWGAETAVGGGAPPEAEAELRGTGDV
jgi:N-acetylglucosaminyldiphosphoundecaprenol N-acetyl-beta-D-mannosaminyltransferase